MKPLRDCDCGGEAELVHSFQHFFVMCYQCGASGKSYASSTKVNGKWPKDAAEHAWNDRVMEEGEV